MVYKASVEVDVEDAFNDMRQDYQQDFIKEHLDIIDDDDLLEEVKRRGLIEIDND